MLVKEIITEDNSVLSDSGSNISVTGMEKRRLEKKLKIKPGTDQWFRLWFTRPYLTGESPVKTKNNHSV